jgi:hypothetical protein
MRLKMAFPLLATLVALAIVGTTAAARAGDAISDGRQFVERFYQWYVPKALAPGGDPPWKAALEQRGADFDPALRAALEADLAAQARVSDEIVGLDFDPFLNTQDPAGRYKVGSATRKGEVSTVEVREVDPSGAAGTVAVRAVVSQEKGRWRFTNFSYPDGSNLLDLLKTLKAGRSGN